MLEKLKEKPRIIVLASTYPRWANDTEPGFVAKLCQELSNQYDVHVLAPHYRGAKREETLDGVRIFRYRYAPVSMESLAYSGGILENLKKNPFLFLVIPFFLLSQLISLSSLNNRFKYKAVHAHWIIPQGIVASFYKRFFATDLPLLITSHGGDLFALNGFFQTKLKKWVLQQANHITVVSRVMKEYAINLAIPPSKITVRSMGVDLKNVFSPVSDGDKGSDCNRSGVIYVGRLVEKKGVEYLIEALSHLKKNNHVIPLQVVGSGPEKKSLETLVQKLGITENVKFLGAIPNSEIPSLLRRTKIAVIPSVVAKSGDQEGLGLVAVEAMGCECVVVASDLPAIRDVVEHGLTGLLVEPKDSAMLAKSIEWLLKNPDEIYRYSRAGREFVLSHFDWELVGKDYCQIIANLQIQS